MNNEITRKQFADLMGWAPSYVTKLGEQGRLVLTADGKRVRVAESRALIEATAGGRDDVADRHAEGRAGAGAQAAAPPAAPTDAGGGIDQARRVRAVAEARMKAAQADQAEMERDKMAGNLIPREDVDFVLNDHGATLRVLLENLADRLAPVVFPLETMEETHAAINEAAEQLLREMADTMRRRAEQC